MFLGIKITPQHQYPLTHLKQELKQLHQDCFTVESPRTKLVELFHSCFFGKNVAIVQAERCTWRDRSSSKASEFFASSLWGDSPLLLARSCGSTWMLPWHQVLRMLRNAFEFSSDIVAAPWSVLCIWLGSCCWWPDSSSNWVLEPIYG